MFMNPAQSWTTILALLVLAAAVMWLIHALIAHRSEQKTPTATPAEEPGLRPSASSLYDWQKQGI